MKNSAAATPPPFAPVAVIGIGGMFPKSPGIYDYWRLLFNGIDAIGDIPDSHWSPEDYYDDDPKAEDRVYVSRGGFLDPVDFDPTEFGIPPAVLEATDTSQLLGLMVAKQVFNDAGYGMESNFNHHRTSVVLGVTGTQELVIPLGARLGHPIWKRALERAQVDAESREQVLKYISDAYVRWQESSFPGLLGNVVAGRISNRLNLGGTNCVVDAACASSLAALNTALLELNSGNSDMVLSGGVDTLNDIFMHKCFAATQILSPSGDVRPFSADADGTLLGEGIGMLLLKRLEDAQRDEDRIYGVIRGIGTSSDGRSQSIYAPRKEGQIAAIQAAYAAASIDPATVGMLEAHGTGTLVGDKVEVEALKSFFDNNGPLPSAASRKCVLGSVKSMIGHTKAAAGAAGLLKGLLALNNKVLLPTLKASKPDPDLGLDQSRFYLSAASRPWIQSADTPRRCGVSSFGFGGSNFHVVLEEHQQSKQAPSWDGSVEILALSAEQVADLSKTLAKLDDLAKGITRTQLQARAARSRKEFKTTAKYRLIMVVPVQDDPRQALKSALSAAQTQLEKKGPLPFWQANGIYFGGEVDPGRLAFVFPGQGSQYCGMGNDLACVFPQALDALETANRYFEHDQLLSDFIFPLPAGNRKAKMALEGLLRSTDVAQPAIGAVSVAMLRILRHFGLAPEATAGHSYGELPALWAAGKFDLDTCFQLSVARGTLMAAAGQGGQGDPGSMLAVKAPLKDIDALLTESGLDVILANRNSPSQGVLSGATPAIDEAAALCKTRKFKCIKLPVAAAFHSRLVASAQQPFQERLAEFNFQSSAITPFANTTAAPYPDDPGEAFKILGEQIINPVNFAGEIANMHQWGVGTFVEVGPKNVLCGLIKAILPDQDVHTIAMDASGGRKSGLRDLANALGHLAALGYSVDLTRWERQLPGSQPPTPRMKVPLKGANYHGAHASGPASGTGSVTDPAGQGSETSCKPSPSGDPTPPRKPAGKRPVAAQPQPPTPNFDSDHTMTAPKQPTARPAAAGSPPASTPGTACQPWVSQALATVQEGIKSIQALQQQTAAAHEKFLETQAEANRTIQTMIHSTRGLAPGQDNDAEQLHPSAPAVSPKPQPVTSTPAPPSAAPVVAAEAQPLPEPAALHEEIPAPAPPEPPASMQSSVEPVGPRLLAVVSELTGYPEAMLDLNMDIEGDLGIDSIKRVEILSTLEEQMPQLPSVAPEVMGSLKTLGQIVSYLEKGASPGPALPLEDQDNAGDRRATDSGPSPATAVPPPSSAGDTIQETLLGVVSDLTGYPVEMLGLDMDIEADLGIDSIKRVEILSTLEEKMPQLPSITPDQMGQLKTLGDITTFLSAGSAQAPRQATDAKHHTAAVSENPLPVDGIHAANSLSDAPQNPDALSLERRAVAIQPTVFQPGPSRSLAPDRRIVLIAPSAPLGDALAQSLAQATRREVQRYHWEEAAAAVDSFSEATALGGLVLVADAEPSPAWQLTPGADSYLKTAFAWVKLAAAGLNCAPPAGEPSSASFLATVSFLDGAFGFKGQGVAAPLGGGLAGLAKTAALEWPGVLCRAFDLDDQWKDWDNAALRITAELTTPPTAGRNQCLEIGLSSDLPRDTRNLLTLEPMAPVVPSSGDIKLGSEDVVLVTGGARGITAHVLETLAAECPATYVLLGRSSEPFPEPAWLKGVADAGAVKAAIAREASTAEGKPLTPRTLEELYLKYMHNREITANLEKLRAGGANIIYRSLDIRDARTLAALGKSIEEDHGPVTAILHGAGIVHDRRIADKTRAQFDDVFDTKVQGFFNVLSALEIPRLKYIVLFSSVSARSGNVGQADYAMANEVLNKVAQNLTVDYPAARVCALNWGPWEGGMVTPALKRSFARQGVGLISYQAGAAHLLAVMGRPQSAAPVETVVGAGLPVREQPEARHPALEMVAAAASAATDAASPLRTTFSKEIDLARFPILDAHRLDGIPVVPFALMTEWLAHGALHDNPGLSLLGFDDMRLMSGIRLDQKIRKVELKAGQASRRNDFFEVPVELLGQSEDSPPVIHSRARAILTETSSGHTPAAAPGIPKGNGHYGRSIGEIYRDILFHGTALQGLQRILSLSSEGMSAQAASAPRPQTWLSEPLRSRWLSDPLVLDTAFQMASLWCFEQSGSVSLPSYAARYRQFCRNFPAEGVTIHLCVNQVQPHKLTADFSFMDKKEQVLAVMEGYEAVMDESLMRAFKPQNAA